MGHCPKGRFQTFTRDFLAYYHLQHAPFALSTTRSSAVHCSLKSYSSLTAQEINPVRTLEMNN